MTTSAPAPAPGGGPTRGAVAVAVAYVALLGALVAVRLPSATALWLDEALSVNIARLPVPDLLAALREDGSPPFYYLLLHGWIAAFGTATVAVRAFSTLCALLALPVAYLVGRRLGGRSAGAAAALLLAGSPFAIRYATETRMYALVMLLTLVGILAVLRALDRPSLPRLAVVALVAGLAALTHYWTLFLLVAAEFVLLGHAWRHRRRNTGGGSPLRVALALPLGAVLFLPWLPSFLFQAAHTGTPWAATPTWLDAVTTVRLWSGPPQTLGLILTVVLVALVLAGLAHRAGGALLVVGLGGLLLGLATSRVFGAGFALRYSAPDLAPVLLVAALGAARLRGRAGAAAVGAAALLGLGVALFSPLLADRTQAPVTAALLRSRLQPPDLVVYCPDQLGPAVDRLLPAGTAQVVYPTLGPPQRVDWVDYASRNGAASPAVIAATLDSRAAGAIWLVRADGYRTFADQCAELDRDLAALRGGRTVLQQPSGPGEVEWLVRYPAGAVSTAP